MTDQEITKKKAELFDEFMRLCTNSSPVRFVENLGELYQKGSQLIEEWVQTTIKG